MTDFLWEIKTENGFVSIKTNEAEIINFAVINELEKKYNQKENMFSIETREELLNKTKRISVPEEEEVKIVMNIEKMIAQRIKEKKEKLKKYFNGKKWNWNAIATDILNETKILTTYDNEEMFYYEDGFYKKKAENKIKETLKRMTLEEGGNNLFSETLTQIKTMTYITREKLNADKNLINFRNGTLNTENNQLQPHNPNDYLTWQLPVDFIPDADCPKIKKFINEIVNEQDTKTIQEMVGYCLLQDTRFQKAFMLHGEGSNGKSTLIELLGVFFGEKNISSRNLQELSNNRFATASLFGKLVNIYADLSEDALKNSGTFKMLTTGDTFEVEKKFKDSFSFKNYAKLIFSANRLPAVNDDTNAFFRRWLIIDFPNTFSGENENKNLITEITTNQELSGLANYAIEGLKRLLSQQGFSNSESTEKLREKYIKLSDSLKAFCLEKIIETQNDTDLIEKDAFYTSYADYCRKNHLFVKSKEMVGRKLMSVVSTIDGNTKVDGRSVRVWRRLTINPESIILGENQVFFDDKKQDTLTTLF